MDTAPSTGFIAPNADNHREIVLSDLTRAASNLFEDDQWVCATHWQEIHLPTYSQRVTELRRALGWDIQSRRCRRLNHKHAVFEYRLRGRNLAAVTA